MLHLNCALYVLADGADQLDVDFVGRRRAEEADARLRASARAMVP